MIEQMIENKVEKTASNPQAKSKIDIDLKRSQQ